MSDQLQVIDIQLGDGKAVVKGALITTQYRGFLEDGSSFDSSYDRGKPFQCVIGTGRVIKGWAKIFICYTPMQSSHLQRVYDQCQAPSATLGFPAPSSQMAIVTNVKWRLHNAGWSTTPPTPHPQ